jgi:hypothetical protein
MVVWCNILRNNYMTGGRAEGRKSIILLNKKKKTEKELEHRCKNFIS